MKVIHFLIKYLVIPLIVLIIALMVGIHVMILASSSESLDDAKDAKQAAKWYQFEFGQAPTPEISNLKARQWTVPDMDTTWISFNAGEEYVKRAIARGFSSVTYDEFSSETSDLNAPPWWNIREDMQCYRMEPWKDDYNYSAAFLTYNPESKTVFLCHITVVTGW